MQSCTVQARGCARSTEQIYLNRDGASLLLTVRHTPSPCSPVPSLHNASRLHYTRRFLRLGCVRVCVHA